MVARRDAKHTEANMAAFRENGWDTLEIVHIKRYYKYLESREVDCDTAKYNNGYLHCCIGTIVMEKKICE